MKKFTLLFAIVFTVIKLFAQNNPPVAVNDTVPGTFKPGDLFYFNVLQNDYDPDGDSIKISFVPPYASFTDSTISFIIPQEYYADSGYMNFTYRIEDEHGLTNMAFSQAVVYYVYVDHDNELLDINNISARFNAFGNHFWDFNSETGHYQFPKGSEKNTLFNFNMWLGGMNEDDMIFTSCERYRQVGTDFRTGPLSFNNDSVWITDEVSNQYYRLWKLNKTEVAYHILHFNDPGYEPIENIATWPAHGNTAIGQAEYLAPFIDMNNDGQYDPMQGDYPLIRGDQSLFFIYNDQKIHTESQGLAMGVEIHGFAYAFNDPEEPWMNNSTFLSYKIFNRSANTYIRSFAGLFSDIDLGYAWDDFVGCDVARGAFYCYNGDSIDGNGEPYAYGNKPPAQGIVILGGPYMDPDGIDNPSGGCDESINGVGFGDGQVDNERYGMNHFIYFNNLNLMGDPTTSYEYYNYMKNIWPDSTSMLYGGNGHLSGGAYGPEANFMFPGVSDPCNWGTNGTAPNGPVEWSEVTAGNNPSDRRGLSAMGPFTLEPGGFQKIDIAFVTAQGEDHLNSLDKLKEYIDLVKEAYYADPDHFGYAWLGTDDQMAGSEAIQIFPNPVHTKAMFKYTPTSPGSTFDLVDTYGRVITTGVLKNTKYQQVDLTGYQQGLYFLRISDRDGSITLKLLKK